jgi:tRNA uridine 5-carboxymethylaminomethyl modification enzyme
LFYVKQFDAIVVGGGHAGIEASRALAQMGQSTLLISLDSKKIGAMSCNPAIGGVAKSHLVYEIDALGGWMGAAADLNGIQARRLNLNKGPAVRSTRIQCDKDKYAASIQTWIRTFAEKLEVLEAEASGLIIEDGKILGVRIKGGGEVRARVVIITAGTFMRGIMFCGEERKSGGRYGDSAADLLTESILNSGHKIKRLKTGTPARLRSDSIDFARLERQWGDPERRQFSWRDPGAKLPQLCCYMTYTNERTHEVIRANFDKSPLFSGDIQGVGPRYCPSVEDKVRRFADKDRHQIFLEPEGLDSNSIYPNGMSTSLPANVQLEFMRTIVGLESVEFLRPGYAVEYDSLDPTELGNGFMSKHVEGLFFAGQVNRTSGYEEAAAQGLWAGINAALLLQGKEQLRPDRSRSYMETLVDDLVTKGTEEPYRLFTSRSEYRLLLREDNALERMFGLGTELGLLSEEQIRFTCNIRDEVSRLKAELMDKRIRLDKDRVIPLFEYLKRPEVTWEALSGQLGAEYSDLAIESVEIDSKYSGYLGRQVQELKELQDIKAWKLDPGFDVGSLPSLSQEVVEKFRKHQPKTVFELSQVSGITPAAVLHIARAAGRRESKTECFT